MQTEQLLKELDYLLSAALKKCGNMAEAEDITQETLLSALLYLKKGGKIENIRSFLSATMNNKYYDMLRKKYRLPTLTVEEGFDTTDEYDLEQDFLNKEDAETIRCEVAFLTQNYRSVIVKYYFENQSIKAIAEQLNIPSGTVKSRLDFGRKQVKKGFERMEKYAKNSYTPQKLDLNNSGTFGINEEPFSLVCDDLLAQNLLILAYDKPISVGDLSKAIGVAAAYVEPIVKKLVDGQLMKQNSDGKVYSDFIIYQPDDWFKYTKEAEEFTEKHIEKFLLPFKKGVEELKENNLYSEYLERFMIIQIAESGLYSSMESIREKPQTFPQRPNGGRWIAFATVYPENFRDTAGYKGKHNYRLSGRRCSVIRDYLDCPILKFYNYESTLDKYSHLKHSGYGFDKIRDTEMSMLKFFYLLKKGIDPNSVAFEPRMMTNIPLLEERGFISTANGKPRLLVPVLSTSQEMIFFDICKKAYTAFAENIRPHLAEYCKHHKKTIPDHLKSVPDPKLTLPYEPAPMMFVYEAIKRGVHKKDLGFNCPEALLVFD